MKFARALPSLLVTLAGVTLPAFSQQIFTLPASGQSNSNTLAVSYSPSTFTSNGQFLAGPAAYRVISNANGSKFYVLTNATQTPLYSVSGNYATVKALPGVYSPITGAVLTPDGSGLYVRSAGTVIGYNTSGDTLVTLPPVPSNTTVIDLDASIDGTQVFFLLSSSLNNTLQAVSNSTHALLQSLLLPMVPSGLTVGPNGLVYVTGLNTILEIDPNSYSILHQYTINGTPGKLAFTPDGHYALANNTVPNGAVAVTVLDLQANSISGTIPSSTLPPNITLSSIWPINASTALGYVQATHKLYTISLAPLGLSSNNLLPTNKPIVDVTLSNDVASGSHPNTQYLFFATSTSLQRFNLTTGLLEGGIFPPSLVAAISYTSPGLSGTAAALLPYGNYQTVATGAVSQPIVVRAVDSSGNPLNGVSVTFQAPSGVTLQKATVTTNLQGYASTTFTSATLTGAIAITAQATGGASTVLNATIGTGGPGNGIPASIKVIAGQGELAYEVTLASAQGSPISVLVSDSSGNPVANTPITFQLTQGLGSLVLYQGTGSSPVFNKVIVPTDEKGIATVDMVTAALQTFPGFDEEVITASLPSGISAPVYFTTVSHREPATVQLKSPLPGTVFSGAVGSTIKGAFQFQVFSNAGPGLPNVSIRLLPTGDPTKSPSASCVGVPLSNSQGLLTCDLVFNGIVGQSQVIPQVGYLAQSLPFTIEVGPGAPGKFVKIQGDAQTVKPGQKLPLALVATLQDAYGNILVNTPVSWSVTSGTGTVNQATQKTDKNGTTLAYVTMGPTPGTVQVTVSAGPASSPALGNFTENAVVVPGGLNLVSGNGQTANVGAAFAAPLVVQALDDSNHPVQGVTVSFGVTSGGVTLSAPSAVTDANGNASITATAPAAPGTSVVTATYGTFSATFNLNTVFPGPANVAFLNGATFETIGAAPGAIAPGEILTITGDNLAPDVQGVVTPPPGPLPTTLSGVQVLFGGVAAPLFAVVNQNGQQQINALVPFELGSVATTSVTIVNDNGSATLLNVPVQPLAPGFFVSYYNNQSYAVMIRASDGSYITPQNLAKPGDTVIAFVNGLGQGVPVIGSSSPGSAQTVNAALSVSVNGLSTGDVSAVYQAQAYGMYLVTFQVPKNLQPGLYPLTLSAVGPDSKTYAAPSSFIAVGQ